MAEPEAEANADPHFYGYYGYGRLGYRTKWVDGYGYANYGHYLGKREAEADPEASPEAEADPALLYSTSYGLGDLGHLGKSQTSRTSGTFQLAALRALQDKQSFIA